MKTITADELYPHQKKLLKEADSILNEKGLVYIVAEPRTGKTLTAIFLVMNIFNKILVFTKKKALSSWEKDIELSGAKNITVTNYENAHKMSDDYDCIILDEAHSNLGAYPKIGARAKTVKEICTNKPIIYLSATPSAESYSQLFHQLAMSSFSPWSDYKNFYAWFKDYGVPQTMILQGRTVNKYNKTKEELVKESFEPYKVTMSKVEADFDVLVQEVHHKIHCSPDLLDLIQDFERDRIARVNNFEFVAETPPSLMSKLHQLSGGTIKQDDQSIFLSLHKVNYIQQHFLQFKQVVILCNYVKEREMLTKYLQSATQNLEAFKRGEFKFFIGHIKAFSEGVDFSYVDTMVIYSLNFSATTYIQAKERLANKKRTKEIYVHFLFTYESIDQKIYDAVSNKMNFTASYYKRVS